MKPLSSSWIIGDNAQLATQFTRSTGSRFHCSYTVFYLSSLNLEILSPEESKSILFNLKAARLCRFNAAIPSGFFPSFRFVTLTPGDVFLTGTPPGVGVFRNPPIFLKVIHARHKPQQNVLNLLFVHGHGLIY